MSANDTTPQSGELRATGRRQFSRGANDAPGPIYVNAIEFMAMGMDVFMDAGVIPPESILAATGDRPAGGSPPIVDFLVNFRFGMSLQTAVQMHQRLSEMLQRHGTLQAAAIEKKAEQKTKEGG